MTYEMIDANNTVALLVDHQAGLMLFSGDIDPIHLRNNSVALAKVLSLHNIPTVLTAAAFGPQCDCIATARVSTSNSAMEQRLSK